MIPSFLQVLHPTVTLSPARWSLKSMIKFLFFSFVLLGASTLKKRPEGEKNTIKENAFFFIDFIMDAVGIQTSGLAWGAPYRYLFQSIF